MLLVRFNMVLLPVPPYNPLARTMSNGILLDLRHKNLRYWTLRPYLLTP